MTSLGAYLRAQREERGVSLDNLIRETRISRHVAEALEEDRYEALPAPVFTRGFIRAYLRHLGLPADGALAFYAAKLEPPVIPSPARVPVRSVSRRYAPVTVCLASALILSVGLYAYVALTRQPSAPLAVEPAPVPTPAPPPLERPKGEAPASGTAEAETASLRLVVRATEPTWVRVETDAGETKQELLPVDAVREWWAQSRFILTVGNAGGIRLELNGRPLPPLGRSGQVVRDLILPGAEPQEGRQ